MSSGIYGSYDEAPHLHADYASLDGDGYLYCSYNDHYPDWTFAKFPDYIKTKIT